MCWARNAPSSTFTAIPSPLPGTVTECTPSAPTFEITRPPVSSIITVSNRSVPPNTNGFARIAVAVRAGRSSPTSTACPHREYASAIAVTGSAITVTPHPSTPIGMSSMGTPLHVATSARQLRCTEWSARSYPCVGQPAVVARASIPACLPEQLFMSRENGRPLSRASFAPRADSGSCGPQARSPSSRPIDCSMRSAIAMCSGSPPCEAHASASSSSPHPTASNPPDDSNGSTWNNFEHDRHIATSDGSRATAMTVSPGPTTAACTRWRDSMLAPRVTTTSRASCLMTTISLTSEEP